MSILPTGSFMTLGSLVSIELSRRLNISPCHSGLAGQVDFDPLLISPLATTVK